MHEGPWIGPVATALSGLALVMLAGFMGRIRPRLRVNLAFATFLFFFGGSFIAVAGQAILHLEGGIGDLVSMVLVVGSAVALGVLGYLFPVRVREQERVQLWIAGGVWVAMVLVSSVMFFMDTGLSFLFLLGAVVGTSALSAFFTLMTLRFRTARDASERRQVAIMAAAVAPFVGIGAGRGYGGFQDSLLLGEGPWFVLALARFVLILVLAGFWISMARGDHARTARNLGLFSLSMVLAGLLIALFRLEIPVYSAIRFLMVAIFSYAILRHQFLGVDLKVRWGVSKSVLAGAFVAIFFVVTELTKWFFETRYGGLGVDPAIMGIAAAGLLLFAVSPLQRVADQIAQRAVPSTGPAPGVPPERRERSYKRMVARFLADGRLSRDEERALAELAGDLGIDAGRAFALREEAETELAEGGGP